MVCFTKMAVLISVLEETLKDVLRTRVAWLLVFDFGVQVVLKIYFGESYPLGWPLLSRALEAIS